MNPASGFRFVADRVGREWKSSGQRSVDREDRLFRRWEAVMEWVLKLEARTGWGEEAAFAPGAVLDRTT